jgi:DNA-binding IclR family transcriptional regulator
MTGTESSLERMLRVLDAIEESDGQVTSEELLQGLGYTRSTLYRYLKILSAAGLITSLPDAGYTFGPRVAELDYLMRNRDPLIIASRPVMAELVRETPGIALLCRRYRNKVLCVHQERGNVAFTSTYERGRARPLTRGAASRIILAYLPSDAAFREGEPQSHAAERLGRDRRPDRAGCHRHRGPGLRRPRQCSRQPEPDGRAGTSSAERDHRARRACRLLRPDRHQGHPGGGAGVICARIP